MSDSHVFEKYLKRHGHYPHVVVRSGVQRLTIEFAPGYVRISTSSPHAGEVYITAQAVRELARQWPRLLSLLRKQDRSVDVPKRMHAYHLREMAHLDALRKQKRFQRTADPEKAARQKKRYEAAKRRALERS